MKIFFIKFGLLISFTFFPFLLVQLSTANSGDKFATLLTKTGHHLILGLSRASYGITPQVLQQELKLNGKVLNIAMGGTYSPYGKSYFEFIRNKLKKSSNRGVHILSLTPASIMNMVGEDTNPREKDLLIYNLLNIKGLTYLEYLLRKPFNLQESKLFQWMKKWSPLNNEQDVTQNKLQVIYHEHGWKEAKLLSTPIAMPLNDSEFEMNINSIRVFYLKKIIAHLKLSGDVFLVRLPISIEYLQKETQIYPSFDEAIQEIAKEYQVPYLNYTLQEHNYQFYEQPGHHFESNSAQAFTKQLAKDIKMRL